MYLSIIKDGELAGYVYSPFRMYDLMAKMFSPEDLKNLSFKIYDAGESDVLSEANLLFDSEKALGLSSEEKKKNYKWLGKSSMYLYNSKWIIEFFAAEDTPLYTDNTALSNAILTFGAIITVLLLVFFTLTMIGQFNSQSYANKLVTNFEDQKNELFQSIQSLKTEKLKFLEAQKIAEIGNFEEDIISGKVVWSKQMYVLHNMPYSSDPVQLHNYISLVPSTYKKQFSKDLDGLLRSEELFEFTFPTANVENIVRWITIKGFTVFDAGKPTKVVGIAQDVTKRRKIEASYTEFVNLISEKLQQPVDSIKSLLEAFLSGKIDNLDQREYRTVIDIETITEDVSGIINRLSSIVKLESGELTTQLKLFHPKDLVRLVVSNLNKRIKEKSIGISVEISDRVVPFVSDVQLLNEVLSILLSNAIKYSSHLASVLIKVDASVESTTFAITDTGGGIPETEKKLIFEKSAAAKAKSDQNGTGLSLYYAKKVTEILGGNIILDSVVGKGTTITVVLPKRTV